MDGLSRRRRRAAQIRGLLDSRDLKEEPPGGGRVRIGGPECVLTFGGVERVRDRLRLVEEVIERRRSGRPATVFELVVRLADHLVRAIVHGCSERGRAHRRARGGMESSCVRRGASEG